MTLPQDLAYAPAFHRGRATARIAIAVAIAIYTLVGLAVLSCPWGLSCSLGTEAQCLVTAAVMTITSAARLCVLIAAPLGLLFAVLALWRARAAMPLALTALVMNLGALIALGIDAWSCREAFPMAPVYSVRSLIEAPAAPRGPAFSPAPSTPTVGNVAPTHPASAATAPSLAHP